MFTLCMSRPHPPLAPDPLTKTSVPHKQVKGGYLLRYRKRFLCKGWSEEWVVLYEDSTLAFFADKGLSRARGRVRIADAPDLLAVGEWTRKVPRPPRIPHNCRTGQLMVVGGRCTHEAYWLMAQSTTEVNDWMTAISNTLPTPPPLPLEDKRCTLTPLQDHTTRQIYHSGALMDRSKIYEDGHTVLAGVALDWGRGLGWGEGTWMADHLATCSNETAHAASTLYCHTMEDYAVGGYEEVDWSAFGDFCF